MAFRSERRASNRVVPVVLFFAAVAVFVLFSSNVSTSVSLTANNTFGEVQPNQCPVILYNKQFKTGSTVISNILFRTSEAYGCRNADCKMQVSLMNGTATHVGTKGGLTMTCHASETNHALVTNLRTTHGNNFIYLASVREPLSWFKSAASFFYRQRGNAEYETMKTEEGFKAAIDWALQGRRHEEFEGMLFRTMGLPLNATRSQIMGKLLMYDLIIDNSKMDEGLAELEQLTKWTLLPCTDSKEQMYRGNAYDSYRTADIKRTVARAATLYDVAVEVREARQVRPLFAVADEDGVSN